MEVSTSNGMGMEDINMLSNSRNFILDSVVNVWGCF